MLFYLAMAYMAFFSLSVAGNLIFWLKIKGSLLFGVYDFLAGVYMIFVFAAYWLPGLKSHMGVYNLAGIAAVIFFDFYFSVWGNIDELGIYLPEMTHDDIETAKVFSIIFTAPAYITASLVAYDIIKQM